MTNLFQHPTITNIMGKLPTIKQLIFSICGIILFVFLFLSLLSFDAADSAWSHVGSDTQINNVGGRLGAWVADILHAFFGYGSWVLVLVLAYELVRLWWTHVKLVWALRICAYALLMLFVSGLLAYIGALNESWSAASLGGAIGYELQKNLTTSIGAMPTALVLLLVIVAILVLGFEVRWRNVIGMVFQWIGAEKTQPMSDEQDEDVIDAHELSDDEPLAQDDENLPYQAHNHAGALESFLQHSGLREELIAKEQAEQAAAAKKVMDERIAEQMNAAAATDANLQAQTPAMDAQMGAWQSEIDPVHFTNQADSVVQTHEIEPTVTQEPEPSDAPSTVERFKQIHKVGASEQIAQPQPEPEVDETEVSAVWQTPTAAVSEPAAPTPAPAAQPIAKSRAMDTLSHRLSLTPLPDLDILDKPDLSAKPKVSEAQLQQASELLEIKLQEFNIQAQVVSAMVGPVVTRFEVELAPGVKASRVTRVSQDLARSMSKASLRVVEVIPGKPYIGIEVPNDKREMVRLIELLDTPDYRDPDKQIAIAVGKDIGGQPVIADLAKAPHMLVAGTTGSGKSVLVNSFLMSILLKYTPDQLKLVLIDPKQLELANYGDIPHLLTPVITDMKDAVAALTWCVNEMERRYQLMSKLRVRKISEFNKKVEQAEMTGEPIYDPLWQMNDSVSQSKPPKLKALPTIVIVADEFADMIMQLGKTAEEPIVRLAQKARAAGIHLLLATQRPTVNVVTGLIKANVPARVALRVNSKVDSRTIIEEGGAEDMLGHGDMMFIGPGKNSPERVHGAYVDDDEVNRVCDAWRERGSPDYIDLSDSYTFEGEGSGEMGGGSIDGDELYEAAAAFVVETRKPSISAVQRKFSIGYNRAARLLDQMEERGLVSSMDHSGKRQLLL